MAVVLSLLKHSVDDEPARRARQKYASRARSTSPSRTRTRRCSTSAREVAIAGRRQADEPDGLTIDRFGPARTKAGGAGRWWCNVRKSNTEPLLPGTPGAADQKTPTRCRGISPMLGTKVDHRTRGRPGRGVQAGPGPRDGDRRRPARRRWTVTVSEGLPKSLHEPRVSITGTSPKPLPGRRGAQGSGLPRLEAAAESRARSQPGAEGVVRTVIPDGPQIEASGAGAPGETPFATTQPRLREDRRHFERPSTSIVSGEGERQDRDPDPDRRPGRSTTPGTLTGGACWWRTTTPTRSDHFNERMGNGAASPTSPRRLRNCGWWTT